MELCKKPSPPSDFDNIKVSFKRSNQTLGPCFKPYTFFRSRRHYFLESVTDTPTGISMKISVSTSACGKAKVKSALRVCKRRIKDKVIINLTLDQLTTGE